MTATRGLLMVTTGNGKGKSTSALGAALRMAGHGKKVAFLQCIKNRECGEHKALQRFTDLIDVRLLGEGFTWTKTPDVHQHAARSAWIVIQDALANPDYALIVLDEFTYVLEKDMVSFAEFSVALSRRPPATHVLVTGRRASTALRELADLVSEIVAEKHPYEQGIPSQEGVEF